MKLMLYRWWVVFCGERMERYLLIVLMVFFRRIIVVWIWGLYLMGYSIGGFFFLLLLIWFLFLVVGIGLCWIRKLKFIWFVKFFLKDVVCFCVNFSIVLCSVVVVGSVV